MGMAEQQKNQPCMVRYGGNEKNEEISRNINCNRNGE